MIDFTFQNLVRASPEVLCEHEVCAEQFKAVLEGVHLHLCSEHGSHQGVPHAGVDHLLPLPLLLHPSAKPKVRVWNSCMIMTNLQGMLIFSLRQGEAR